MTFAMASKSPQKAARVFTAKIAEGHGLFAAESILPGELIVRVDGDVRSSRSRFSIQIGLDAHLDVRAGITMDAMLAEHFWWFLNHHCEPNAMLSGLDLIAIRPIAPKEEVTFNYNTTEVELIEAFACRCGSQHCAGMVRGFRHLSAVDRERLKPWLAAHLLPRVHAEEPGGGGLNR